MIKITAFKNDIPYDLDVDQNEDIEIVYEVKNLKIDTRSTFFTKTFNLYGSRTNNSFFEYNFTSNASFNNRKYNCRLYLNGYDIIEGVLILKGVEVNKYTNNIVYTLEITNKFYDFLTEWSQYKLTGNADSSRDVDFSSVVRFADYSAHQMESSWTGNTETHPFVYTIANYGYYWDKPALTSVHSLKNMNSLLSNATGVFPSLYLKTLTNMVFKKIGISSSSPFFSSDEFNKILVLNPAKASYSNWGVDSFTDPEYSVLYTEQPNSTYCEVGINNIIEFGFNSDPINPPFLINNEFVNTFGINAKFVFDLSGYIYNIDSMATSNVSIWSEVYDSATSTWGQQDLLYNKSSLIGNQNVGFNITPKNHYTMTLLNMGDKIRFYLTYTTSSPVAGNQVVLSKSAANFQFLGYRTVKASNLIPKDLTYGDFLTTLFRKFDLIIYYEDKEFKIDTYKNYFNSNVDTMDLTNTKIVDKTSYQLSPLNEIIPNRVEAIVEKGEDDLSIGFENTYKTNYGNAVIDIGGNGSNLSIQTKDIITQFDDNHRSILTPYIYKIENNAYVPINGGLRFVYWNGLVNQNFTIKINNKDYPLIPTTSLLYDVSGNQAQSPTLKWGYIGNDTSDALSTYKGLTTNNGLLNNYYYDELKLLNKNEYKLTLKLDLKFDLGFKMNTLVYLNINGIPKHYRIEKITFSSNNSVLTQLELIPISNIESPILIINSEGKSGSSSLENVGKNTDMYGNGNLSFSSNSAINGDNNTIGYSSFIKISGVNNIVSGDTSGSTHNIIVEGNNNVVGQYSKNLIILGDNNNIPEYEDGAIYINGEKFESGINKVNRSGDTMYGDLVMSASTISLSNSWSGRDYFHTGESTITTTIPYHVGDHICIITPEELFDHRVCFHPMDDGGFLMIMAEVIPGPDVVSLVEGKYIQYAVFKMN